MTGKISFKYLWRLIYPAGIYLLVTNAVSTAILVICTVISTLRGQGTGVYETIYEFYQTIILETMLIGALISIPILVLFMHLDKQRHKRTLTWRIFQKAPGWSYLLLAVLGASSCLALNNLLTITGLSELSTGYDEIAEILYTANIGMELLVVGTVVPIAEELVFRGLIHQRLRERLSARWACLFSALAFGIFHGNLLQGIYAFVLGLLLAYSYERYHTVIAPIMIHISANIFSVLLTETPIFDAVYESLGLFLLLTAVSVVIVVVSCIVIEKMVKLKEEIS